MKTRSLFKPTFVLPLLFAATFALAQPVNTFTSIGNMTEARAGHTATLLPNGKVLLAGGLSFGFPSGAELYDPSAGLFNLTGAMVTPRTSHTATLLADGRVLIAGGSAGTIAELYDPSTGTFTATGDMIIAQLAWHTATLIG